MNKAATKTTIGPEKPHKIVRTWISPDSGEEV